MWCVLYGHYAALNAIDYGSRKFLELNLVSNQLSDPGTSIDELCLRRYRSDYRRMFIEHPRVRFDGVYIAICHYMYVKHISELTNSPPICSLFRRNGLGENPWVNVCSLQSFLTPFSDARFRSRI